MLFTAPIELVLAVTLKKRRQMAEATTGGVRVLLQ